MGKQQQHQTKTINSQPDATSPALQKSAVDSISEFQEIFGSRAASRQFRSQQSDAQSLAPSLSAKLGMPTIQAKPSFRGLSSELTARTTSTIQPKLTIGEPGDKYEQEADRVAQDVVQRINSPEIATRDDGEEKKIQRAPAVPLYQRVTATTGTLPNLQADFETELNQARGGGEPLDKAFRAKIEPAMNADFSGVRVHTDSQADLLNQSIQAKAFTTGQDVFFEQGAYQPESQKGQELLAHELTHVIQQTPNSHPRVHTTGNSDTKTKNQGSAVLSSLKSFKGVNVSTMGREVIQRFPPTDNNDGTWFELELVDNEETLGFYHSEKEAIEAFYSYCKIYNQERIPEIVEYCNKRDIDIKSIEEEWQKKDELEIQNQKDMKKQIEEEKPDPKLIKKRVFEYKTQNGTRILLVGTKHSNGGKYNLSEEALKRFEFGKETVYICEYAPMADNQHKKDQLSEQSKTVMDITQNKIAEEVLNKGMEGVIYGADGRKIYDEKDGLLRLSLRNMTDKEYKLDYKIVLENFQQINKGLALTIEELNPKDDVKKGKNLFDLIQFIGSCVKYLGVKDNRINKVLIGTCETVVQMFQSLDLDQIKAVKETVINKYNQTMDELSKELKAENQKDQELLRNATEIISATYDVFCDLLLATQTLFFMNKKQNVLVAFGNEHIIMLRELMKKLDIQEQKL